MLITGATIIDGVAAKPLEGKALWIEGNRIKAIAPRAEFGTHSATQVLDLTGKFIIPGLMNANVHLMGAVLLPGVLLRYMDRYEELVAESAQISLKNGLTTVFDTLGMRRPLMAVRDKINAGVVPGARVFCAGWIVGLDGVLSLDFNQKAKEGLGPVLGEELNGMCAENVGPALSWMSPQQVAQEIRRYIAKGIDFVKYASNEHRWGDPTTSLVFSPRVQAAIVEETHRAGLTAQAHTSSIESLHVAVEAGCDLIQHANITGPFPIPQETLELIARKKTGAVLFPFTRKRYKWIIDTCEVDRAYLRTAEANCENLLAAGAKLLLANDGVILGPTIASDPWLGKSWMAPGDDNLNALDDGHFLWLQAMEEKGMPAMEMLRAATVNIAAAYGKEADLGTLQPGKIADLLVLAKNPLAAAANYRGIERVIKDGKVVDRDALPQVPILSKPVQAPTEEVLAYREHKHVGRSGFPMCPLCSS